MWFSIDHSYACTFYEHMITWPKCFYFRLIASGKGEKAVELLKTISVERRNVKQNPLLFALALCARCNDKDTKRAAYKVLNQVCRIPTHLFMFIKFCEQESDPSEYI